MTFFYFKIFPLAILLVGISGNSAVLAAYSPNDYTTTGTLLWDKDLNEYMPLEWFGKTDCIQPSNKNVLEKKPTQQMLGQKNSVKSEHPTARPMQKYVAVSDAKSKPATPSHAADAVSYSDIARTPKSQQKVATPIIAHPVPLTPHNSTNNIMEEKPAPSSPSYSDVLRIVPKLTAKTTTTRHFVKKNIDDIFYDVIDQRIFDWFVCPERALKSHEASLNDFDIEKSIHLHTISFAIDPFLLKYGVIEKTKSEKPHDILCSALTPVIMFFHNEKRVFMANAELIADHRKKQRVLFHRFFSTESKNVTRYLLALAHLKGNRGKNIIKNVTDFSLRLDAYHKSKQLRQELLHTYHIKNSHQYAQQLVNFNQLERAPLSAAQQHFAERCKMLNNKNNRELFLDTLPKKTVSYPWGMSFYDEKNNVTIEILGQSDNSPVPAL